jgi:hypothetical protein
MANSLLEARFGLDDVWHSLAQQEFTLEAIGLRQHVASPVGIERSQRPAKASA